MDSLINLTGMTNLDSVYNLSISQNNELVNLIGLNKMKFSNWLSISGNDKLKNLKEDWIQFMKSLV